MTQQTILFWKIVYGVIIVVLWIPLFFLGRPMSMEGTGDDAQINKSGILAQKLHDNGMSDVKLGKIDPTGSAMKLGTFGMRGVAIAVLWHQSLEYEKRKDWDNVIATSNQIMRLEPHFTTIWEFLGWKLAYNASAEFDDYRERYRWVIRGFDFLVEGIEANKTSAILRHKAGWTISQKIGIADEKVEYRRLLREDEAFHQRYRTPDEAKRDNWLIGIRWYKEAENLYEAGYTINKQSPPLFFSHSRMNLIHYASWLADDGIFENNGEKIKQAWIKAATEWALYGNKVFDTTIPTKADPNKNYSATLLESVRNKDKESQYLSELKNLQAGLYEKLVLDHWNTTVAEGKGGQACMVDFIDLAQLPETVIIKEHLNKTDPEWKKRLTDEKDAILKAELGEANRKLLDIPEIFLNEQEATTLREAKLAVSQIAGRAIGQLTVTPREIASEIQGTERSKALNIIDDLEKMSEQTRMSDLYRGIMNYPFREKEAIIEQEPEVIKAREFVFNSRVEFTKGNHLESNRLWLQAVGQWKALIEKPDFAFIKSDAQFMTEVMYFVERYHKILDKLDDIFPNDFPLAELTRIEIEAQFDMKGLRAGFEYAKNEFEKGDFENAEKHFLIICGRYQGINYTNEYMPLAPVPQIKDESLKAAAYYLECLRKKGETSLVKMPLRDYVELMLKHDPMQDNAVVSFNEAVQLLTQASANQQTPSPEQLEAVKLKLDESLARWKEVCDKYPILYFESSIPAKTDLINTVNLYSEVLKKQGKTVPEDFQFKTMLK